MSTMYSGFRISINGTQVDNGIMQKGSYHFQKGKRITGQWTTAAQKEKLDVYDEPKVLITFTIHSMTLEEHENIKWLFSQLDNLLISYWDDYDCEYKTGYFYMEAPDMPHANTEYGTIKYDKIAIKLTEY